MKISAKTHFIFVPGVGTFKLKSFHLAGQLTSNLVPGAGNLTNSNFKSSNAQGLLQGACWSFKLIDTLFLPLIHHPNPGHTVRLHWTLGGIKHCLYPTICGAISAILVPHHACGIPAMLGNALPSAIFCNHWLISSLALILYPFCSTLMSVQSTLSSGTLYQTQ